METICYKYYQVCKYDTAIAEIRMVDLKPVTAGPLVQNLRLTEEFSQVYTCRSLIAAMEKAKVTALCYINMLIEKGKTGQEALLQYRIDHYEDLNINLVDTNIRKVERLILDDTRYQWRPYRIGI